jgi:hypothetical protein
MSNRKKIVFFICGSVFLILLVGPFFIPVPELTGTVDPKELAGPDSHFTQL